MCPNFSENVSFVICLSVVLYAALPSRPTNQHTHPDTYQLPHLTHDTSDCERPDSDARLVLRTLARSVLHMRRNRVHVCHVSYLCTSLGHN